MSSNRKDIAFKGNITQNFSNLLYISLSSDNGDWLSMRHYHIFSELFYVVEGCGWIETDSDHIVVKAGDLVIINPLVMHTEHSDANSPMTYMVLGIDGLKYLGAQRCSGEDEEQTKEYLYISLRKNDQQINGYLRDIYREACSKRDDSEPMYRHLLEMVLLLIARSEAIETNAENKPVAHRCCEMVKRYIDENYHENLTLNILSDFVGLNKYYLSHIFTKNVGVSPIRYLLIKRTSVAKELLLSTDYTVSSIAMQLGFSSTSYFTQTFTREVGCSPMKYKNGQSAYIRNIDN